jgi:hypothetical protein
MSLGSLVRLAIVLGWLALFLAHVVEHAVPDLGLGARRDLAAVIAGNLGREFTYEVQQAARNQPARAIGRTRLSFYREEDGYRVDTGMEMPDIGVLSGLDLLLKGRGIEARRLTLRISETLDRELRLTRMRAEGGIFGTAFSADGAITAKGLVGSYRLDQGEPAPLAVPGIGPENNQGLDLAMSLPPGLKTGDRFTSRLLSPDLAGFTVHARTAVYTALTCEPIATRQGRMDLLRVEMAVDGRAATHLWCDQAGTVYLSRQLDGGMTLVLEQVREIGGDLLWPPPGARSATPLPTP